MSKDITHGIYGGNNSGFGALMLAIALGANPIYLLGYDMKIESKTHWHSGYPNQNAEKLRNRLLIFKKQFEEFANPIKKLGIDIVNLNPNSALSCFKICSPSTVLKY